MIRPASDEDREAIIELIDGVYHEYGDQVCLEGADRDLLDLERYYRRRGGAFVVYEQGGEILGTHAALPIDEGAGLCTFRRLYVRPDQRGTSVGRELMEWALDWGGERGFHRVEFWSDIRFERAHRFFEKYGFTKGETRDMTDGAMPYSEYHYSLDL